MRRLVALIITSFAIVASGMAEVLWLETSYDFGTIKEAEGPKEGRVRFVNLSDEPVVILEARPSCGCTTSTFTEAPVQKGDTAMISFTFDPERRPGKIEKSLRVRLSGGKLYRIPLNGTVVGTRETLENFYPVDAGTIRLSKDRIFGGNVTKGKMPAHFIHCYNQSDNPVSVKVSADHPAIKVEMPEPEIPSGDASVIMISLDSQKIETEGEFSIPITIQGDNSDPYTLIYTAKLIIPSVVIKKN